MAIAADHNGVRPRERHSAWLTAQGRKVDGRGSHSWVEVVDCPPLCADLSRRVADGRVDIGVVLGGRDRARPSPATRSAAPAQLSVAESLAGRPRRSHRGGIASCDGDAERRRIRLTGAERP
ncbi:RpiB/LacA/LacB family sugar-phosphate isomerase [Streptomyces carpinensis]|uniref:Uncharacterized protein n=1 Tax=Streptomyces carpinensis TaxID=66369 RepID=A0ABV1VVG3_9ACTN